MTQEELKKLVADGISAVKRGDYELGQSLLLRAVEVDERIEEAWMWLSVAIPSPEDKLTALENVLTINPNNAVAQANARWWRQKVAAGKAGQPAAPAPSPAAAPAGPTLPAPPAARPAEPVAPPADPPAFPPAASLSPEHITPIVALDPDDALNDPYSCAYCAAATSPNDRRCPACGRSLVAHLSMPIHSPGRVRLVAYLIAGIALLSVLWAIGPGLLVAAEAGYDPTTARTLGRLALVQAFLGPYLQFTPRFALVLMSALLARAGLLLVLALALRTRLSVVYSAAVGLLVLDLAGAGYRYAASLSGTVAVVLDGALALAALPVLFSAWRDFGSVPRRVLTELDRGLRGGWDYHRHGGAYRREGKWALAVLHWHRAATLLPGEPQVHKDLAIGYSQLGRFDRAVAALTHAEQLLPDDPEIEEMLALVRARRAALGKAPGRGR